MPNPNDYPKAEYPLDEAFDRKRCIYKAGEVRLIIQASGTAAWGRGEWP